MQVQEEKIRTAEFSSQIQTIDEGYDGLAIRDHASDRNGLRDTRPMSARLSSASRKAEEFHTMAAYSVATAILAIALIQYIHAKAIR
jgi:hypothetical protein